MNNAAWLLATQGKDLNEALRLAQAAVKREAGYVDGQDTLGWVRYCRGEYAQAIAVLRTAKSLAPTRGDVAAHLGMAYAKAGRKTEAVAELKRALSSGTELSNRKEIEQLIQTLSAR